MSESLDLKIKVVKPKHIKGKYSMPNSNCILSYINKNIQSIQYPKKSNLTKTNSKPKKSVKTSNNKSFILRRKKFNLLGDLNIKMITHKTNSKTKMPSTHQSKNFLKIDRKNPYHARIRSFQINYKDKNNLYNNNKIDRSNFIEKTTILIKKNKIIDITQKSDEGNNCNDYSVNKNLTMKKTNSLFEDNESTKNTKILEQKLLNYDNFTCDNKLLILNKNNKTIENSKINERKLLKNCVLKNEKSKNTSFNKNKNRVILKSKLDNLRKNYSTSREHTNRNNSDILKIGGKKKLTSNIVQRIKDKIHLIKTTIEDNYNSARNKSNIDISFNHNNKYIRLNSNKNKKINNNYSKLEKKMNILNKMNSPINFRQDNHKNIILESNKSCNSSNKDKKIGYKKKKVNIYNKYKRNSKKLSNDKIKLNYNSISNILYNNYNSFHLEKKRLHFNGNRSQKELNTNFIEKSLFNDEIKNISQITKIKKPKDLSEKKIDKIETICEKGFLGADTKKINQDNFFIYKNFLNNPKYIFLGVCDGHGTFGHEVSGYLVYNIPLTINDLLIKSNFNNISDNNISQLISLLKDSFIEIDNNIPRETNIDTTFSGSTCVSLIFTPSKLICANVGDSRCIIGKFDEKNWLPESLSFDHKPDNKLEKERILNNRGRIEPYTDDNGEYYGPYRVWLKNGNVPGLAMSRSFGDMVAHSVGVITDPDIIEYSILEEDKFIILASDGIWEFISNEECVNIVKDYYIQKDINGAINNLYKEATKRWIMKEEVIDDITLIIIFLK